MLSVLESHSIADLHLDSVMAEDQRSNKIIKQTPRRLSLCDYLRYFARPGLQMFKLQLPVDGRFVDLSNVFLCKFYFLLASISMMMMMMMSNILVSHRNGHVVIISGYAIHIADLEVTN